MLNPVINFQLYLLQSSRTHWGSSCSTGLEDCMLAPWLHMSSLPRAPGSRSYTLWHWYHLPPCVQREKRLDLRYQTDIVTSPPQISIWFQVILFCCIILHENLKGFWGCDAAISSEQQDNLLCHIVCAFSSNVAEGNCGVIQAERERTNSRV